MTNPYDRHKRRWLVKGETESEEYLNQSIENFNSLVDNMEAPTVHRVKYTLPLDYDITNQLEENILISDFNQMESIMDKKAVHVKLDSKISSGSLIFWDNTSWVVTNEEHKSILSNKTYTMQKCAVDINILYDGTQYTYPSYVSNLTLYSDGKKELVNLDVSSAKYTIYMNHGGGNSSAPVTKGMIDFNRIAVANEADLYLMGHKHNHLVTTMPSATVSEDDVIEVSKYIRGNNLAHSTCITVNLLVC